MKKTQSNLVIINAVFIMSLLVANVVASKVVNLFGLIVPAAVVAYAITFLATDVINEIWGKQEADRTVKLGLVIQVSALLLIGLAIVLPPAPFAIEFSDMFTTVLKQSWRVVFASLVAYAFSQAHDVMSFNFWRKKTDGKHKWLRNNASTLVSQIIDTAIFITIAFWGTVPSILWMIFSQYIVKAILALLDTPFFYLLTKHTTKHGTTK
jgi:uncharacterized integral membrane protein (TIGR00697 family)